jgi:hypothetical protein
MSITRANFGELLMPTLRKVYADENKQYQPYIDKVFNVSSMNKQTETDLDTTGVGYMTLTSESGPVTYTDPLQGYTTNYTTKEYKAGTKVSYELFRDDQYRVISNQFKNLARAAVRSPDKTGFSVFNNAFSTSSTSYGDAKPLCSVSHPRKDGGTAQSNASATSIALSEANLNTGLLGLREVKDNMGNLIDIASGNITLIIPPALEKTGMEITGSSLKSNTANNDLNYYKGGINLLVNPWISARAGGSDTAWFLISQPDHKLNFMWREKPIFDKEQDFETDEYKFKVRGSWCYGWSGWTGLWGSKGDGSAYAS